MPDDAFGFIFKTLGVLELLGRFPEGLSSRREADIQVEKLGRMAIKFKGKYKGVVGTARLRQRRGPDMHRLVQQSKHVDKLMEKLFVEYFNQKHEGRTVPLTAREQGRVERTRREIARNTVRIVNKHLHQATKEMRLLTESTASKGLSEIVKRAEE